MTDYPLNFENTISVSEVNATIKDVMDSPVFKGLNVFGEVSGFKLSGPHAYFTLKDKNSQLSCVCFYAAKAYKPKDGESVIVRGGLDYYVKGGRLSFQVNSIQPVGQGLLFLEFERLKARLEQEGLFDAAHKKPIPAYVKSVLVVTSKTGAVIRDIVTTVRRKNPVIDITVRDVRVQGEGAGKDIATVLKRVDMLGYDVIIIARGGGSLEDLAPFYDEELVRTVYEMNTPVVSAVGHETDFSLCDFAADARAATPTAAGELVAYDYYAMEDAVKAYMRRLGVSAVRAYKNAGIRAQLCFSRLKGVATSFYTGRAHRVERLLHDARTSVARRFDAASARAERATDALDRLSPLKTLKRGYFRLQFGSATVGSVSDIKVGDSITAIGGDGSLKADVTEIILNGDKEN